MEGAVAQAKEAMNITFMEGIRQDRYVKSQLCKDA